MHLNHIDTIRRNAQRNREEARRLDKMAGLCRSAGVTDEALRYAIDAQTAREHAHKWELELSMELRCT